VTIGRLPDDILPEIFEFYAGEDKYSHDDWWHTLIHVCRRWRNVVFTSPRRLELRLRCTGTRSVRDMLDIWPELPIVIDELQGVDNVIAALELNDRVSGITCFNLSSSELERIMAVMQDPFPALTYLWLHSSDGMAPVISGSFLGGSAPRLRFLELGSIPFPALPKLLSSATDLVHLSLDDLPHSVYISPKAMVTCLSTLTRLKILILGLQYPRPRPDRTSRLSPRRTRTVLPALTHLGFKGVTEYLEDLVTQIDAPLLKDISIRFFNQLIFNISQLPKFLCRTETFTVLDQATVSFHERFVHVKLSQQTGANSARLNLKISCRKLDWQLSSLEQVCNSAFPTFSTLERLGLHAYIHDGPAFVPGQDDIENTQWLDLLRPFVNVKDLQLSEKVAPCAAPALQELTGERVKEVLPTLQNIFLHDFKASRPVEEGIRQFVAARQFSGHPVAIHMGRRNDEETDEETDEEGND
jgi:hypothetical protein